VSAFHTAINDATDIYDIVNFEKLAAKVASSQSAVVKRSNNNASDLSALTTEENFDNQQIKLESMESGKVSYLEPGEDIIFPDGPSRPSGAFAEFHKILLRNICMGLGIPYSFAVDPSAMSGPTARLEMQQAGRTFNRYQKLLNDKVLNPIKNIVIADGVARGMISGNGAKTTKGIFNFGANVSIDLGRESVANIAEFKAGLTTASSIYAEKGLDVEAAFRARAIETKMIQDLAKEYGVPAQAVSEILLPTGQPAQAGQPGQTAQDGQQVEGQEDVIGQSLNGAQVASLINVINAVAAGALSKEGAVSVITAAFPTISREQAIGIVAGVQSGKIIPTTEKEKQAAQDGQQDEGQGGAPVPATPKAPVAPTGLSQKKSNLELADDGCGREGDGTFGPGNTCAEGSGAETKESTKDKNYPQYKEAKTREEAEEIGKSYSKGISYRGMSVEYANIANKEISDYIGSTKGALRLKEVKALKFNGVTLRMREGAVASYKDLTGFDSDGAIYINTAILGDSKKWNEYQKASVDAEKLVRAKINTLPPEKKQLAEKMLSYKRQLVDDTPQGIIRHELGHHFDYNFIMKKHKEERLKILANKPKYEKNLSYRASENNAEYIAESYSAYRRQEPIDPDLEAIFNRYKK
jgi:hypothetical protein